LFDFYNYRIGPNDDEDTRERKIRLVHFINELRNKTPINLGEDNEFKYSELSWMIECIQHLLKQAIIDHRNIIIIKNSIHNLDNDKTTEIRNELDKIEVSLLSKMDNMEDKFLDLLKNNTHHQ
jgi:hypothetical protein